METIKSIKYWEKMRMTNEEIERCRFGRRIDSEEDVTDTPEAPSAVTANENV